MTPTLEAQELDLVIRTARELCGVEISPERKYFIESRLGPLIEQLSLKSYGDLCRRARDFADPIARGEFIERVTTHETYFFRDKSLFSALQHKVLPELFDANAAKRKLRIWSAACSTGQEPYSTAMIIADLLKSSNVNWQIEIVATDVSETTVEKARSGFYADYELARCGRPDLVDQYTSSVEGGRMIAPEIRQWLEFETFDLQKDFTSLGSFDLILCRNVLIYFEEQLRRDIIKRLHARLVPQGRLVVGATENLIEFDSILSHAEHCDAAIYTRI